MRSHPVYKISWQKSLCKLLNLPSKSLQFPQLSLFLESKKVTINQEKYFPYNKSLPAILKGKQRVTLNQSLNKSKNPHSLFTPCTLLKLTLATLVKSTLTMLPLLLYLIRTQSLRLKVQPKSWEFN